MHWHIVHRAHKRRYLDVHTGDIYSREYILQPLGHTSLPQCGTFVPAELQFRHSGCVTSSHGGAGHKQADKGHSILDAAGLQSFFGRCSQSSERMRAMKMTCWRAPAGSEGATMRWAGSAVYRSDEATKRAMCTIRRPDGRRKCKERSPFLAAATGCQSV